MGYPGLSCNPTAGMEAGPSFPQEVGMTVGTVFSRNECSVIDCSAVQWVHRQGWVMSGEGEVGEGAMADRKAHTQSQRDLHQADQRVPPCLAPSASPASSEHAVQLKSL